MKDIHIVSIVGLGAIGSYFAEKILCQPDIIFMKRD